MMLLLRYVILEHNHPELHWDLMLEAGEVLQTWKLLAPLKCGDFVEVTPAPDHRIAYLDYEGEISGGRGFVLRRFSGSFEWLDDSKSVLKFRGDSLEGTARFVCHQGVWSLDLTAIRQRSEVDGNVVVRN